MGYIYKITNLINNKSYIGQTRNTIKTRIYKHISQSNKNNITGIDAAIKKYGKENFIVEELCKCSNEDLDEQEKFYIQKYNTFQNGYNLTIGGQAGTTSLNLDHHQVIEKYNELQYVYKVADYFECCEKTISEILKQENIKIFTHPTLENLKLGKKFQDGDNTKSVKIVELNLIFNSLKDCAQWLIDNNYSKASSMEMARKSLSRVLNGDRKTYCKLHFSFVE